jgi:nucleoid-associated protein YgaU
LDYIAYRQLGSAARWREIAQANDLPDPLDLKPGQVLVIPQEF